MSQDSTETGTASNGKEKTKQENQIKGIENKS